MPIVFDQVEGIVEPSAESHEEGASPDGEGGGGGGAHAMNDVDRHLARAQRRQQRLNTD
jgi:hypothetical protein